jgi:hypothetical protein
LRVNVHLKSRKSESSPIVVQPRKESGGGVLSEEKKLQEEEALRKRIREMVRESIVATGSSSGSMNERRGDSEIVLGSQ